MKNNKQNKAGDISVTMRDGNTVGSIGHVFINQGIKRSINGPLKQGLLKELPRDKPVSVMGMNGNTESINFANEIHALLKENGFAMVDESGAGWHMFFDPPVFDIKISPGNNGSEWWIIVGPAE